MVYFYYTLERDNRELQQILTLHIQGIDYTLERDNRELQLYIFEWFIDIDYTLERDNRELQQDNLTNYHL